MLGSLRVLTICLLIPSFASAQNMSQATAVTVKDLETFLKAANERLNDLSVKYNQAQWVQETYITDDTEAVAAAMNENYLQAISDLAAEAKRFDNLQASPELTRQLKLLKLLVAAPAPNDPKERAELARLGAWLSGITAKANIVRRRAPLLASAWGRVKWKKPWPPQRIRRSCLISGWGGARFPHPCARITRVSRNLPTRLREKWDLAISVRSGVRITT